MPSLAGDLRRALRVLPSPVATYRSLDERPGWLAPWLLASVATVLLTLFTISISQRASVHLLADLNDPQLARSVALQLQRMKWVSLALAPLSLLARWTMTASLLWAAATFAFGGVGFRRALTVAAYAGLPAILGSGLDLAVTWFQGPEFTPDLVPVLSSASSVAAFLPATDHPEWLAAALRQITLFSVWSGALWVVGLRELGHTSWRRAALVGAGVWGVLLVGSSAADVIRASLMTMASVR